MFSAISVAAFVAQVAVLLWMALSGSLLGRGPIALALQVSAVLLMIWARLTFGARSFHAAAGPTEGQLVTTGPYAIVRHPIYAAIALFTLSALLSNWSSENGIAALVIVVATVIRVESEERLLRRKYCAYADYSRHTSRILPLVY